MKRRPKYSPDEVARLVREGSMTAVKTVVNFLTNHEYDAREVTTELLTTLQSRGDFLGSPRLKTGVIADEYRVFYESDDSEWFVKFYVEDEQLVVLLSCWWDGSVH